MAVVDGDPLSGLSADAALAVLDGDDATRETVAVVAEDDETLLAALVGVIDSADALTNGVSVKGGDAGLSAETLCDSRLTTLLPSIVSIELGSCPNPQFLPPLTNLRSLELSCATGSLPRLASHFPRLLSLDISFLSFADLSDDDEHDDDDDVSGVISGLPQLRRLIMSDCDISDDLLTSPRLLGALPNLTHLDLSDNIEVDSVASVVGLAARVPNLVVLKADETGACGVAGWESAVLEAYPSLKQLDKKLLKTSTTGISLSEVDGLAERLLSKCANPSDREESCSCLEGNACVNEYGCKNWKQRSAVAAAARAQKRLNLK